MAVEEGEVTCGTCGVALVKDVNWLPGSYNHNTRGRPTPIKQCRPCNNDRTTKYRRKQQGYKGQFQRPHNSFERRQREVQLGVKLCGDCWAEGRETVLVLGVTWSAGQASHKRKICVECHRMRVTACDRKKGVKPMPQRFEGNDFYVYMLIDEHDHVYYIGSGKNGRVEDHLREVRLLLKKGTTQRRGQSVWTEKRKTIRRLLDTPEGYRYEKVATGLTKIQSLEVESFWIEVFGLENLTNEAMPYNRGTKPIPPFRAVLARYTPLLEQSPLTTL